MKVWLGDECFDTSLDWTFREERTVYRLLQLRPGDWWREFLDGSSVPVAAVAIVGFMRAKPLESPDFLVDTKVARPDDFELDEGGVLRLKLDFSDEKEEAATTASPPAAGGAAAKPRRRASQSRRKS